MSKKSYLIVFMMFISVPILWASNIPNSIMHGKSKLLLIGEGTLKFYGMIEVYKGGLYLSKETKNQQEIIEMDEPMAVKLFVTARGYKKEQWEMGWHNGFDKVGQGNMPEIGTFLSFFKEDSKMNDYYDITYIPSQGCSIAKNGKVLGKISGFAFKKALFSIWLGPQQDDKNLKIAILKNPPKEQEIPQLPQEEPIKKEEIVKKEEPPKQEVKKGKLFITANPQDAKIRFIGISKKFSQGIELEKGKYQISIMAQGYEPEKKVIVIKEGEEKKETVNLKKKDLVSLPEQKVTTTIIAIAKNTTTVATPKQEKAIPTTSIEPIKTAPPAPEPITPAPTKPLKPSPTKETSAPTTQVASGPVGSFEIGGINIPDSMMSSKGKLILNGAGIRRKFGIKIYVGALYLKQKTTDGEKIASADEPMITRMHLICRGITGRQFSDVWTDSFKRVAGDKIATLEERVNQFIAFFKDGAKEGEYFDIVYSPGDAVKVSKNGSVLGKISGFDFKEALFSIWVGARPVDANLKTGMLTGK
ncbi:MAG: chalcone isomerase family protein [Desulfobacterales bacterium]|nr:chalcone isomerase family protein [Desulfobacterales bacterium]